MKYLILLCLSFNIQASTFKFKYGDKVKMIRNINDEDEFYKCVEKLYTVIDYDKRTKEYTLSSIDYASGIRCDKNQPESNLIKAE